MEDSFRIISKHGTFQMTKADFYRVFDHILKSKSYRESGIFHYRQPPQKALQFLVDAEKGKPPVPAKRSRHKFPVPEILKGLCKQKDYTHWLYGKAAAHVRRDKKRGNILATPTRYREAIHQAVCDGGDKDAYTGQPLRWDLIRTYNNKKAKSGGRAYKKNFADLPTLDHVDDGLGFPNFKICSWRINDCKSDLTHDEFIEVCKQVLAGQKGDSSD